MYLTGITATVFSLGFYLMAFGIAFLVSRLIRLFFNSDPEESRIFPLNPMSFFLGMWFAGGVGMIYLFLNTV